MPFRKVSLEKPPLCIYLQPSKNIHQSKHLLSFMEYSYFSGICYFSNTIDGFHRLYIYIVTNKVKKKDGEVFRSDITAPEVNY